MLYSKLLWYCAFILQFLIIIIVINYYYLIIVFEFLFLHFNYFNYFLIITIKYDNYFTNINIERLYKTIIAVYILLMLQFN